MTDENLESVDSGSIDNVSQESASQGDAQQFLGDAAQTQQQEKTLTQSQVNDLLAAAKRKAYEKGVESTQASQQTANQVDQQQASSDVDIASLVDKRVAEIAQQHERALAEQQAKAEADKCVQKIQEIAQRGKESIENFEASMQKVDGFQNALGLLKAAADIEDAEHVLHYLSENPAAIPSLDALATNMPKAAKAELEKIGARLKQNADAKKKPFAPEPISRISPNNQTRGGIGSSDKPQSEYSVRDFMEIYKG